MMADRQGRLSAVPAPVDRYRQPRFSPDGGRLAVAIDGSAAQTSDIWIYTFSARTLTRLTFDSTNTAPTWTPDGQRVAFSRGTSPALFTIATDGSGVPETLLVHTEPVFEAEFSADARTLVFRISHPQNSRDIWMAPLDSPQVAVPLLRTPFNERGIALTPDGRWLAYVSNETGTDEVYLRRPQQGSPRWRVSAGGGSGPRWARAGRELFFWGGDTLFVVPVEGGAEPRIGGARPVLTGRFLGSAIAVNYDVSRDGDRIVLVQSENEGAETGEQVHVVLHWPEWFQRREQ